MKDFEKINSVRCQESWDDHQRFSLVTPEMSGDAGVGAMEQSYPAV